MLSSVAQQLDAEDRLVIVDAGSTDDTHAHIERYRDAIAHVEIAPLRQAAAIRWGFDNFDSDLCCYLNTDDMLLPGAIHKVKTFFARHPEQNMVYSNRVFVDSGNRVQRVWALPPHCSPLMRRWDYIPQETCFWRRQAMADVGGVDPKFEFAMDYDFFCRLMSITTPRRLNDYLAVFREHTESKTHNQVTSVGAREVAQIRKAHSASTSGAWHIIGGLLRRFIEARSARVLNPRLLHALQHQVDLASRNGGSAATD